MIMSNLYGYAGKILRVNLSDEQISEEKIDEKTARKYIGGTGLGAKYLYDEVPAGVGWSDEDNRIIISTGPLGGTTISGSGTISVVTKGSLTNGATATQSNGFFGAFLKFSGYDGIILQGKSKKWLYLYIHDDKAELKDSTHLVGKDTWETSDSIKEDLGKREREISVASIGPAGENLVKFACIFVDKGHTASHNGNGAVMGSKNLKAIAVSRGQTNINLKDKDEIYRIANQFHNEIINDLTTRESIYRWGTLNALHDLTIAQSGIVPVKNYITTKYEISLENLEKFSGHYIRSHFETRPSPCWACKMHHCHIFRVTKGPWKGYVGEEPEYEDYAAFGPLIGVTDATAAFILSNETDRLGMDSNEMG